MLAEYFSRVAQGGEPQIWCVTENDFAHAGETPELRTQRRAAIYNLNTESKRWPAR